MDADDPQYQDDIFTLYSTDTPGTYKQSKTLKDDKQPGDSYVDLEYTFLIPEKNYSLSAESGTGKILLFENVPFSELASLSPSDDAEQSPDNVCDDSSDGSGAIIDMDPRGTLITEGEPVDRRGDSMDNDVPELDNDPGRSNNFPDDMPNPFGA